MKKEYKPGWRSDKSRTNMTAAVPLMKRLKVILPACIVLTMAGVVMWPKMVELFETKSKAQTMDRILKKNPTLANKVINPKLDSLDQNGRPFSVEAEFATHVTEQRTDFTNPSGNMKLEDGSTLFFESKTGVYMKEQAVMELHGEVHFRTDKGYDLKTSYMKILPKENRATGDQVVKGRGPSGETIEAEGFRVTDKGDQIDFTGKTKISLTSGGF